MSLYNLSDHIIYKILEYIEYKHHDDHEKIINKLSVTSKQLYNICKLTKIYIFNTSTIDTHSIYKRTIISCISSYIYDFALVKSYKLIPIDTSCFVYLQLNQYYNNTYIEINKNILQFNTNDYCINLVLPTKFGKKYNISLIQNKYIYSVWKVSPSTVTTSEIYDIPNHFIYFLKIKKY
jgi:hypothetical protein